MNASALTPAPIRCAIYTRKSSDEGLEQAFNSLHAQRELCEAYVRSQAGEGWRIDPEFYDDGGHSGATLARPAMRRLLADVAARRIDVVVVYKVDRLTRSLSDFARVIEAFDRAKVSFVSVTQAFNTTSSMGRLTLNVLLSFAQFEREVTGERIRDKIAASKAKGIWMGGAVPLGYDKPTDPISRALVVNIREAETVKLIFRRLLELGSTFALQTWLHREGIRSKRWVTMSGRTLGGLSFSRGALTHMLKNRTYLGEIPHKAVSHRGRHSAIIDRQTFDAVQAILAQNARVRRERVPKTQSMMLSGKVFDADGEAMAPLIHKGPKGRTYKYYAAPAAMPGEFGAGDDDTIRRVPAAAIETLVTERVARLAPGISAHDLEIDVRPLVARVEIHASAVHILLRLHHLATAANKRIGMDKLRARLAPGDQVVADANRPGCARIILPVRLKVRGGRTWTDGPTGRVSIKVSRPDRSGILRLRTAHSILRSCGIHPDEQLDRLRHARAPCSAHQVQLARWAFLAPDIQRGILTGSIGPDAVSRLKENGAIPLSWDDQRVLVRGPQSSATRLQSRAT